MIGAAARDRGTSTSARMAWFTTVRSNAGTLESRFPSTPRHSAAENTPQKRAVRPVARFRASTRYRWSTDGGIRRVWSPIPPLPWQNLHRYWIQLDATDAPDSADLSFALERTR